jgi:hypothetical protein
MHAQEFVAPVAAEVPGHHLQPRDRIDCAPWLGAYPQQEEFGRQHRARREQCIHAGGVGIERCTGVAVEVRVIRLRRAAQAQRAHEAVGFKAASAEHLGQATGADAPVHLELPQAVLRVHEAEREVRVALRSGKDVRHAVGVAQDLDRGADPRDRNFALELRQRLPKINVSEEDDCRCQNQQKSE